MTESVDSIIEGFPYSSVEKIKGELLYHSIKEVEWKLIKNVLSFPSELEGGNYGYLGLILKLAKYQLVTGETFTPYSNPDSLPTFLANSTQPQIVQISNTYIEQLRLWQ